MIPMPAGDYVGQMEAERGAATAELEGALAEVFPDGTPDNVEVKIVEGDADEGSCARRGRQELTSSSAFLRSGIASVLLGSVSRHVVSHAPCPSSS